MHIIIVYANTGNGHKKLAKILQEYLVTNNTNITLVSASDLLHEKNNLMASHWNWLLKKNWIFLADLWINFISRIIFLPFYYSLYDKLLFRNLDKLKPDMIISTAPVNRLIGGYCQSKNIPFFVFITSGAIFVDMLHQHATHVSYFNETAEIVNHVKKTRYFKQNITPTTRWHMRIADIVYLLLRYTVSYRSNPYFYRYRDNLKRNNELGCKIMGPLREKKFYEPKNADDIKKRYNIAPDECCILISNGGLGGSIIIQIITAIQHNDFGSYKLHLLATCGSDQTLHHQISNLHNTSKIRITALPTLDSLAELYYIADCSIGRATAGILMDSVVSQTPLIVLKKVTCNDFGTLDMIKKQGIGLIAPSPSDIPHLLKQLLHNKENYKMALKNWFDYYGNHTANDVERILRTLVFESACQK